jgi:hypothetical protein
VVLGGIAETLTFAELDILDGVTGVTAAELSYIGDVTGLIQAQIDLKSPLASPTFTGTVTVPTPFTIGAVSMTATGTELNYLDIAALGTGAASKAVVLDGSGNYTAPAGTWDLSGVTAITLRAGEIVTADIAADQITNALIAIWY